MNLTARLSRRLAAGVGLASAAILLPTAALASSAVAGSPAHPAHPAIAGCVAANTRVWYGLPADHATGHTYYEFQISNIGRSTCTLYGYPGVSALNSAGHEVGLPASHNGSRVSVTLAPGATAHVVLVVVNASLRCSNPVPATQIRVYPPGQFHSQSVPLATQACLGRSVLQVDSVQPRAGIPDYSIR
ncbi:MAG TPA: DUF4232 domain-containing protein [Streptosporangiaceae bacterium]|nr:DUF4232 domain-containing protein [Streptosporangiaceae bacterium]